MLWPVQSTLFPRILAVWAISLIGAGVYFVLLQQAAPRILERDRNTSVWYLNSLADEAWREFEELPLGAAPDQKLVLLESAEGWLEKAHQLRPESAHYLWYWALTQHELSRLTSPVDTELMDESVRNIERVLEMTERKWIRPILYLAHHHVNLGKDDNAKTLFQEILELKRSDTDALEGLLQIAYRAGDYQEYTRLFDVKSEYSHPTPEERETLATIALRYHDYDRASTTLADLFASGGETKDRWFLYCVASVGRKDLRELIRAAGMCLSAMQPGETWPLPADLGLLGYPSHLVEWVGYSLLEAHAQQESRN